MKPKYLRFEQLEVFRPMPVTQQMRERIRQEAQKAKELAEDVGVIQQERVNYESKSYGV
jgi:hypothetical protein